MAINYTCSSSQSEDGGAWGSAKGLIPLKLSGSFVQGEGRINKHETMGYGPGAASSCDLQDVP